VLSCPHLNQTNLRTLALVRLPHQRRLPPPSGLPPRLEAGSLARISHMGWMGWRSWMAVRSAAVFPVSALSPGAAPAADAGHFPIGFRPHAPANAAECTPARLVEVASLSVPGQLAKPGHERLLQREP
jgi:hypothetical protein